MMFSNVKLCIFLAFVVAVAASSFEKRGSSVLLGYRTISPTQAKQYLDAGGTLTWTKAVGEVQLGKGVYLTPGIAEWPGPDENWDCAILADSKAWNLVNKAWIPATDGCNPLWYDAGEAYRSAYLKDLGGASFKISNTVLLSEISGWPALQLLIPPQLLGASGGLNIVTQCAVKSDAAGIASISLYGNADYSSWLNVKGTVQTV